MKALLTGVGLALGLLSGTTLSVPALTGAIMTMGVATANSILMVSFARQRLHDGLAPLAAAHPVDPAIAAHAPTYAEPAPHTEPKA